MLKPRYFGLAAVTLLLISLAWVSNGLAQNDTSSLGAQVYAENCVMCHGENGEGRVGELLSKDWPSIRPELMTKSVIEQGVPGTLMPSWGKEFGGPLSEEEIDAVVAFILGWQTGETPFPTLPTATAHPPISPVPDVEGDPNQGAILFHQNCAVCHGPNGEGRIGSNLAKPWSSVRPDLSIKETIARGVSGSLMPAWSQGNGGPLSDTEIDNIVAYILSWKIPQPSGDQPQPEESPSSWITGWGGVFLFWVIFILLIAVIVFLQRRKPGEEE